MPNENLGAAEKILQTVFSYSDHAVHNRVGVVSPDIGSAVGVKWVPVSHSVEGGQKVVYELRKVGRRDTRIRLGILQGRQVIDGNRHIGRYQPAGLYPEVATWMYRQVAEVWKMDNEFAAKWASYSFGQDHKDMKVILAAFMLVQCRKGDSVLENGRVAFYDEDYRDVGEAMLLLYNKSKDFNPKLLLWVYNVLTLPEIAAINRELGFEKSARKPFLGRWPKAVKKYLRYREENPRILEGLVRVGFQRTVMDLASTIGYKPSTSKFFETLRWKQVQAKDGRRSIAIGKAVAAAESWADCSEEQICQIIIKSKPNFKRIVGFLPKNIGLSRAIMAAAIEAGSLSDKDMIIVTPTLEELGLLDVQKIRERWEKATKTAEDMRAMNIATRVRSKAVQEKLMDAADIAVKKAVEEVVRGIRIYFMVDISGSMTNAIVQSKAYLAKFLQGFPPDQIHVSVFNTMGRVVGISHSSAAGIDNAFRGISACGGTDYGAGVRALQSFKPKEDEDVLFIFVGDEEASAFTPAVTASGLKPIAFGFLKVRDSDYSAVRDTAAQLGIPCFMIDERIFADPYAIPRTIRALVASTPVGVSPTVVIPRQSLVDVILSTKLLQKPTWAA